MLNKLEILTIKFYCGKKAITDEGENPDEYVFTNDDKPPIKRARVESTNDANVSFW